MPGNPGELVVTTLVCFLLCTRGCGCTGRPAFPAPSLGGRFFAHLGRTAPRERRGVSGLLVIASPDSSLLRAQRSNPFFLSSFFAARWIASLRSLAQTLRVCRRQM